MLRREPDDGAAAAELVRRSGKTPDECAAWSARARRRHGALLATLDAAEGRRPPGAGTTLLTLLHQRAGVAATAAGYRRAAVAVALAGTALVGLALALAGVALRRRAGPRPPAGPHPPSALRDEVALARKWLSAGKRGG